MKKLFKEIWKSFSKTKSLILGLTVLIFLSSGVFTLLSDVKANYTSQFDDYKKVSKIHDLTVDTEIEATGEKPSKTYIPDGLIPERTEYVSDEATINTQNTIRFPQSDVVINPLTKEGYIQISKLNFVGSETNNNYLKVKDLYRFLQVNNISNFVNSETGVVESRRFPPTPLKEYELPGISVDVNYRLNSTDKITVFKSGDSNITLGDLVMVVPGVDGFFSSTDDRITNVKSIYINADSHEATISQSLKQSWEKQGKLITITPDQVAKLLGFTKSPGESRGSIYSVNKSLGQQGLFDIVAPTNNKKWRLSQSLNKTIKPGGFSINYNNTIINDIVQPNSKLFFVIQSNFVIPKAWIVKERTSYEYVRYHSKINYDFLNSQAENNKLWTKNYKDYMLSLTKKEQEYYSQTSYWKKTQIIEIVEQDGITVIDPKETIRLSESITSKDLNRKLKPKNGAKINGPRAPSNNTLNTGSILWIERESKFISNEDVNLVLKDLNGDTSIKIQKILNDANSKNNRIKQIDDGAKAIAQQNLYNEILRLVGDIDNIGLRENITVSGFLDNIAHTFHFINGGNENQEIKLNNNILVEQNVGKLYNESKEKSLLFELSSKDDIMSTKVPESYIFKITDLIFSGMSVDKNYIDPIITFENYSYIPFVKEQIDSSKWIKMSNAKIIRMQNANGQIYGITKQAPTMNDDVGRYYILEEKNMGGKKTWFSKNMSNSEFDGSSESMAKFIEDKDLNFATTKSTGEPRVIVGPNGWAKQNPNYENKYSIPFKLVIPGSDIINNWQESNNFNVFRDNLINSLTSILEPLISPKNLKIILEAATTSMSKNGFADVLTFPSQIQSRKLQKIIFGIFYEGAKYNEELYWNSFLDEILNVIISNPDPLYINKQIENINKIFQAMFGNEFDIASLLNYVNDPREMLIGLRKIIASIDIDATISQIWMNFYDNSPNTNNVIETIGTGDILPILLNNIFVDNPSNPNVGFKAGLKQIITQLNFSKIIKYLKDNVLDADSAALFGPILDQLNGNLGAVNPDPNNDFVNMNIGLNKIIDLINLDAMATNIKNNSVIRTYYVDHEQQTQKYIINSISVSGMAASLLNSLGHNNDNDDALHNAMIELLNISSKTELVGGVVGVYQPESDPNKLDIRDLQSLLKSPTPELQDLETSLKELSISLNDPNYFVDPESTMGKYLTNYIFNFAGDISIANYDIKKRVDVYLEFMQQTEFVNFDPNMASPTTGGALGGNIANPTLPSSLADKFINMINPNVKPASKNPIYDIISTQVYNEFYNDKNPLQAKDMTVEILNFYSFWMKFAEINLQSSGATTNSVASQIINLVNNVLNKNSFIGKILNSTTESFNPNLLLNFKILDGFSNVKATAMKFTQYTPGELMSNGITKEAINYYFDYDEIQGKLKINNNTISLVSGLSSIISIEGTTSSSAPTKADLVTKDFINLFLPKNDKEKSQIMLTLGQRTLKTLSGGFNYVLENLGISSVIMSPFSAVLNAPVLMWFTVNQNAIDTSSLGNLAYVIKEKLYNFNSENLTDAPAINYEGFEGIVNSFIGEGVYIDEPIYENSPITLSLDLDYLEYLSEMLAINPDIFGVNLSDALLAAVDSFTEVTTDDYKIVISDVGSYLAKVSSAYLKNNKKEIYPMTLENAPKDSLEMQNLIENTLDKYKINVNGLEFLIIGEDATVDYLYPVTDLNNIQVNTETQALVYVNQSGFDRVKESNANAVINKYFLVVAPNDTTPTILQNKINEYIYVSTTGLNNYNNLTTEEKNNALFKKAYLYNETNPLKPEISLRVQTIETLISTINNINLLISSILIFLIGIITIFVIKRYVSSRSKVLGILKAQGYRSIQIAASICLFALIVAFFGATLGYIVGYFLQIPVMNIFSIYWTLPIGPSAFNVLSLIITVLVPLIGLVLLTIITTLFLLKVKPVKLMDGSFQLNNSKTAEVIKGKFHSKNIKSKFTLSLSLNSIWKLISLLVSLLLTVTIMSFSLASQNAFGNAVNKTYKNRKYDFKIELITPTLEGGAITTFDKQSVGNLLYVPIGNPNEGSTYLSNYFAPGPNDVINPVYADGFNPNGTPSIHDKHIITKSSFDLFFNSGGVETNVWDSLFNSMPDSQRVSVVETSQYAAKWLEWTQGLTNYGQSDEYKLADDLINKAPYFKYLINLEKPEDSKFVYRNINDTTGEYYYEDIVITGNQLHQPLARSGIREKYREFLVSAYDKSLNYDSTSPENENAPEFVKDFFLTFGSVMFDETTNEKFSYATTVNQNDQSHMPTINGFDPNSKQVQILDNHGNNLLEIANNRWDNSKEVIPIIINHVVKDKRNLNIGSQLELTVINTTNRFTENIKKTLNIGSPKKTTWTAEVIGINETFINEEWTTTQKVINAITYLDDPQLSIDNEIPFNGILSTDENPVQATESLGLYSENGYWSANNKIDLISTNLSSEQQEKNTNIFKELFYKIQGSGTSIVNNSVFAKTLRIINPNFSHSEESSLIEIFLLGNNSVSLPDMINPGMETIVNNALEKFSEIYNSNNVVGPSFKDIQSKNIESGFISNTTNAINSVNTMVIVLSLLISVTILIMISTLIISENERNVAIFSILGYSNIEKMKLFFSLYIPIILLSIILSIPLTIGLITMFSSVVNSTVLISLSISLGATDVLFSSLIVALIFSATSLISWLNLNRIKPIMLLKGE